MREKWRFVYICKLNIIIPDDQQDFSKKLMHKCIVNGNKFNRTSSFRLVSSSLNPNILTHWLQLPSSIIVVLTPSVFSIRGICISLSGNVMTCRKFTFFRQVDVCHKTSSDATGKVPPFSRMWLDFHGVAR